MDIMPLGGLWLLFVVVVQFGALVLVVLGIIWLVRHLGAGSPGANGGPNRLALDELEMRYARGEIDRSTYLQMQDDLKRPTAG
jgi:putative membrane protein